MENKTTFKMFDINNAKELPTEKFLTAKDDTDNCFFSILDSLPYEDLKQKLFDGDPLDAEEISNPERPTESE